MTVGKNDASVATVRPIAPASFEFATATRIIFGSGTSEQLPRIVSDFGSTVLVVTGSNPERHGKLIESIGSHGATLEFFPVAGEPTVDLADSAADRARGLGIEVVVAIGGGSAIDAGKAIAALTANSGSALDYLEVVGLGNPLERPSLPFVAVPTTAGTGAEVTRNAVLGVPDSGVKASLRSPSMLPRVALVDPSLTHGLPPMTTATTGMDALTQLIEPFLCSRANPMTDAFCRDGIPRAARSLRAVFENPMHAEGRSEMSYASLLGGLALANSGLGAVHGFAAPIGGAFPAPHGAVCAALLPHVMATNLDVLRSTSGSERTLERFDEVARMLTGRANAVADDAVTWSAELSSELGIPNLGHWGIRQEHIASLVGKAAGASSMKANPVVLADPKLTEILNRALV